MIIVIDGLLQLKNHICISALINLSELVRLEVPDVIVADWKPTKKYN